MALINGTQFICALGSEALYRAEIIAKQADVVAALSIDVLQGTPRPFDRGKDRRQINEESSTVKKTRYDLNYITTRDFSYFIDIHIHRPHCGQQLVAGRLRSLLDSKVYPSEIRGKV